MTNSNWPLVSVQVAFNAGPNTSTTPTWTDITTYVKDFSGTGGRQYELDQVQAGQYTMDLLDPAEQFNPANSSSPYFPNVLPYRPMIIQAMWPPAPIGVDVNLLNSNGRQPGTRVFYDPTFESYATGSRPGWIDQAFQTTPSITTAQAWQGTHSLTWTVTGAAGEQVTGFTIRTIPGQQYTASVWVRQTVANTTLVFISGVASGTSTTAVNTWTRLSITFTATQPTHIVYTGSIAPTLSGTVYLDAVQLETGATANTFATAGPVIYGEFAGYIERWPTQWDLAGRRGWVAAQVVDAIAILAQQVLNTEVVNTIQSFSPTYYWPLWDDATSAFCGEASGNGGPPLTIYTSVNGAGNGLQLGDNTPDLDGDPGGGRVAVTPGNNATPTAMDCQILDAGPAPSAPSILPINPIPTNPAVAWSATVGAWVAASLLDTSSVMPRTIGSNGLPTTGVAMTAVNLVCPPVGSVQPQPLTLGLVGSNLFSGADPGFEAGTVGSNPAYWGSLLIGAPTITNAQAHDGTNSCQWPVGGGSGLQGMLIAISNLDTSKTYVWSIWVRQTVANTLTVGVQSTLAYSNTFDTVGNSTSAVNSWQRLFVIFTPQASTTYFWVYTVTPANTGTVFIDSFQLESGPYASPWSPYGYAPCVTYIGPTGVMLAAVQNTQIPDGQMHYLAATISQNPAANTTLTLYLDGRQTATATATTASLGGALSSGAITVQVGGQATNALVGQSWNGQLSHVAIWTPSISADLIYSTWFFGLTGYVLEYSGDRIRRWLGYAYGGKDSIEQGVSQMGISEAAKGSSALQLMLETQQSENGTLFVDGDGYVQFYDRNTLYTDLTPLWTLGEQYVPYQNDIQFDFDPTQVYNDITISRNGGVSVELTDLTSQQQYGTRGLQLTSYVASDSEVIDAAHYYLANYKEPGVRINTLNVDAAGDTTRWPTVLGMDIADRIRVVRTTSAFTFDAQYFLQQRSPTISFADGQWTVGLQANPINPNTQPWILGDATFGVLGSTTILAY